MIKLFKASFLATAMAVGFMGPANAATTQQESLTIFYDDEAHDNQVGSVLRYCDGSFVRSGTPTLYSDYYYFGCD